MKRNRNGRSETYFPRAGEQASFSYKQVYCISHVFLLSASVVMILTYIYSYPGWHCSKVLKMHLWEIHAENSIMKIYNLFFPFLFFSFSSSKINPRKLLWDVQSWLLSTRFFICVCPMNKRIFEVRNQYKFKIIKPGLIHSMIYMCQIGYCWKWITGT